MDHAFKYKPRFVDIRIKPPEEEAKKAEAEKTCDWAGCNGPGECRAPMGPDRLDDHYYFCPAHAAAYNKNWNFFAEMSDAEVAAFQSASMLGGRPTWQMNSGARLRDAATKAKRGFQNGFADPFGVFADGDKTVKSAEPRRRKLGRLEARALDTLGLEETADAKAVRIRYAELVKVYHPDMNGGDRSSEQRLQQVIEAYQMLKKAGMA